MPIGGGALQLVFVARVNPAGISGVRTNKLTFARMKSRHPIIKRSSSNHSTPCWEIGIELLRIPVDPGVDHHWALSPDGLQVGILKSEWGSNQIRFFQLHGGESLDWRQGLRGAPIAGLGSGLEECVCGQLGSWRLKAPAHRPERQGADHLAATSTAEYMGHSLS